MHGGRDRQDGTDVAGDTIDIHHNTLYPDYMAVCIRGVPREFARVHHNWFASHRPGETSVQSDGSTTVSDNAYGPEATIA
jgi:uncharacterized Fe-S cluster protein YjdI